MIASAAGPVSPTGGWRGASAATSSKGSSARKGFGKGKSMMVARSGESGPRSIGTMTDSTPAAGVSLRQEASHPSPVSRFPSSQSSRLSRAESPQRAAEQFSRQRSGRISSLSSPRSHSSPGSKTPFPQKREEKRQSLPQRKGSEGS